LILQGFVEEAKKISRKLEIQSQTTREFHLADGVLS